MDLSRPLSPYHNTLVSWINSGLLMRYEVTNELHKNTYDNKAKMYIGKKQMIKILRLYFINGKSYFIREEYINDYLKIIESFNLKQSF